MQKQAIASFGLSSNVAAMFADNASNMVAGFSLPLFEIPQPDDKDVYNDSELVDLDTLNAKPGLLRNSCRPCVFHVLHIQYSW